MSYLVGPRVNYLVFYRSLETLHAVSTWSQYHPGNVPPIANYQRVQQWDTRPVVVGNWISYTFTLSEFTFKICWHNIMAQAECCVDNAWGSSWNIYRGLAQLGWSLISHNADVGWEKNKENIINSRHQNSDICWCDWPVPCAFICWHTHKLSVDCSSKLILSLIYSSSCS